MQSLLKVLAQIAIASTKRLLKSGAFVDWVHSCFCLAGKLFLMWLIRLYLELHFAGSKELLNVETSFSFFALIQMGVCLQVDSLEGYFFLCVIALFAFMIWLCNYFV